MPLRKGSKRGGSLSSLVSTAAAAVDICREDFDGLMDRPEANNFGLDKAWLWVGGAKEKDDADGVLVASRITADNAAMRMDLTLMVCSPKIDCKKYCAGVCCCQDFFDRYFGGNVIVASVLARRRRLMDDITLTSLQRSFFEIFRSRPSRHRAQLMMIINCPKLNTMNVNSNLSTNNQLILYSAECCR